MLYTRFFRVRPEQADRLRAWFREVDDRKDEALASYSQEGTRCVQAHLLEGASGPVLAFIAEVGDPKAARAAYAESRLPIDAEHREVMHSVVVGSATAELLYECAV